jgi:hypothetical protein
MRRTIVYISLMSLAFQGSDVAAATTYKATVLHPLDGYISSFAQAGAAIAQAGYGAVAPGGNSHALLWHGTPASVVDLHVAPWNETRVLGATDNTQVGYGFGTLQDSSRHALLWRGSAASVIDLHSGAFGDSQANDVWGEYQVGYGTSAFGNEHAVMWRGTADAWVDLHPAGFVYSFGFGVSENSQVGWGLKSGADGHALLWHGTAASAIDLNPPGFTFSRANATWGNSQVGDGYGEATGGGNLFHALLWSGTAASVIDLHPTGYGRSIALGVYDRFQVGWADNDALLWNGSAESAVNLHAFLADVPIDFERSVAFDIGPDGTIVGFARDSESRSYAVMWRPIPEPTSGALLSSLLVVLMSACRTRNYSRDRSMSRRGINRGKIQCDSHS